MELQGFVTRLKHFYSFVQTSMLEAMHGGMTRGREATTAHVM